MLHVQEELAKMDRMARLREQAYDRFRVKLSNVVIALAEVSLSLWSLCFEVMTVPSI